ncbi:MAG: ATP-binding protein [Candidatus Limimorpha sp.]
MEIKESSINVEALKSQLLRLKTTRARFRWPLPQRQAEDILLAAYMAEVEYRQHTFMLDDKTKLNIKKVASYLVTPDKPGLMLAGTCGNGKTTLMSAILSATCWLSKRKSFGVDEYGNDIKIGFAMVHVKDIIAQCKNYSEMQELKKKPYLIIDDLGVEPAEVMDYGNICNPVIDLIEYRYDRQLTTFVTTNLAPEEFKDKYGVRIADRFNEMIHKIVFQDGSYRK